MKKVMRSLVLIIIALLIIPTATCWANLIQNPGFELGTGADADNWNQWSAERLDEFPYSPSSWSLHSWAWDGTGDAGAWQGISVTSGTKLSFTGYIMSPSEGGYHKDPLAGGAEAFFEIEWWQGSTKLDSVKSAASLMGASDWTLYSVAGIAPEGTDSARFICKLQSASGSSGDVYFDNLEAGIIPEPGSLILIGSLAIGLFGLKNRFGK